MGALNHVSKNLESEHLCRLLGPMVRHTCACILCVLWWLRKCCPRHFHCISSPHQSPLQWHYWPVGGPRHPQHDKSTSKRAYTDYKHPQGPSWQLIQPQGFSQSIMKLTSANHFGLSCNKLRLCRVSLPMLIHCYNPQSVVVGMVPQGHTRAKRCQCRTITYTWVS